MSDKPRKIKPVGDRLVVRPVEQAEKTASGIYLPDTAQGKSYEGVVVEVGPGRTLDSGTVVPNSAKVGEHVLYTKYAGSEIKVDGFDLLIISEKDVLAIVEPARVAAAA